MRGERQVLRRKQRPNWPGFLGSGLSSMPRSTRRALVYTTGGTLQGRLDGPVIVGMGKLFPRFLETPGLERSAQLRPAFS